MTRLEANRDRGTAGRASVRGACRGNRSCRLASVLALLLAGIVQGCSGNVVTHGQYLQDTDIQQVQPGMSEDQVRTTLGTPSTTASVGKGNAYYYISSKMKEVSVLKPSEVDRRVVAVYFAPTGTVERVAHYGLKDGKVFDFITRTTPAVRTAEEGVVRQLFRNLGQKQLYGD